jgi:hypothetical protein
VEDTTAVKRQVEAECFWVCLKRHLYSASLTRTMRRM